MNSASRLTPHASLDSWTQAFFATLDDAISLLQVAIFEEGWDEIRAGVDSHESALRESVLLYERALAELFGFVRAAGAPADDVAWSALKVTRRRAALEHEVEITLRTALENALYAAERTPLGDHALYRAWAEAVTQFVTHLAEGAPQRPADDEARLEWAYAILAPLEDERAFHTALAAHTTDRAVIEHQERLRTLPRFDLAQNTALRWLAAHEPTPRAGPA